MDIPNPSVVTLGQHKTRNVGGGSIQSSMVKGVMGGKYSQDAALDDLMQNSLIKNAVINS